jgi:hypothetical protein
MPRPSPPTRKSLPEIRLRRLDRTERRHFAWLLGLDALPDACVHAISWMIAVHNASRAYQRGGEVSQKRRRETGHTPAKWAAALRRVESRMRRGDDGPETTRVITDPLFGADEETFTRLQGIVCDPEVPLDHRLDAIETRRRELEALPEVDALYGLRVVLVAYALVLIWDVFAVRRDDTERQWQFALAILEAAGEGTEGVRKNPKRLKRELGRLLQLTAQPAGRD